MAYTSFIVTKNLKNKLTSFYFFMYFMRAFPYMVKTSFKTPRFKPFRYTPMIKQVLKKHATTQKHAIDAKKIVFFKYNFA